MRVVVAAKAAPKGGKSTSLINYMAKSKLKVDKEKLNDKNERPLFSRKDEKIEFANKAKAEEFLCQNAPNGAPPLSQLIISFDAEELAEISPQTETQDELIRETIGEALNEAAKELETSLEEQIVDFRWVAVIHRNTDHPHVHVAINRQLMTASGEVVTLKHLPRSWLPHRTDAQQELELGSIARYVKDKLEAIREKKQQEIKEEKPLPDFTQKAQEKTEEKEPEKAEEKVQEKAQEKAQETVGEKVEKKVEEKEPPTSIPTEVVSQTDSLFHQRQETSLEPKVKIRVRQTATGSEFYAVPVTPTTPHESERGLNERTTDSTTSVEQPQNDAAKSAKTTVTGSNQEVSDRTEKQKAQEKNYVLRYLRALYKQDCETAQTYAQLLPQKTLSAIEERLARKVKDCGHQFALTLRRREEAFHNEVFEFTPAGTSLRLVELRDAEIERRAAVGQPYEKLLHPTEWVTALAQDLGAKLLPYSPVLEKLEKIEQKEAVARQRLIEKTAVWVGRATLNSEIFHTVRRMKTSERDENSSTHAKRTTSKDTLEVTKSIQKCEERVVKELLKRHLTKDELKDVEKFFATLVRAEKKIIRATDGPTVKNDARSAMLLRLYAKEARLGERAQQAERPYFYETVRLHTGKEIMVAKVMNKENTTLRRMVAAHLLKQKTFAQTRKEKLEMFRHTLENLWRLDTHALLRATDDPQKRKREDLPPKAVSIAERALKEMSIPMKQAVPLAQRYFQSVANIKEYYLRQASRREEKAATIHRRIDRIKQQSMNEDRERHPSSLSRHQTTPPFTGTFGDQQRTVAKPQPFTGTSGHQQQTVAKLRQTETKLIAEAQAFRQKAQVLEARAASVAVSFELNRLRWQADLSQQRLQHKFQPVIVAHNLVNLKEAPKGKSASSNMILSPAREIPSLTQEETNDGATEHKKLSRPAQWMLRIFQITKASHKNLTNSIIRLTKRETLSHNEPLHTQISKIHQTYEKRLTTKLNGVDQLVRIAAQYGFSPSLKTVDEKLAPHKEILETLRPQIQSAQTTLRHNHVLKQLFQQQTTLVYACHDRLNGGVNDYRDSPPTNLFFFEQNQNRVVEPDIKDALSDHERFRR